VAKTFVVDGLSLAFRAWFALRDSAMATSSGQETQAVYGFVSMITRLLSDHQPAGLAVAFDLPGPTFRDAIISDYKAGRTAAPEPLIEQFGLIREFVMALGAPVVEVPGFEADDVLATLATSLSGRDEDVVIVTGDRDSFQLVEDPHIQVLYNRRGVSDYALYDEAGIEERTGVRPRLYPLLAALRGDPSDNLPGVPGVGEKTAAKLARTYEDVDSLFAHLGELTPKLAQSLAGCEEQVRTNLRLIPLVRDVPLELDPRALVFRPPEREALRRFCSLLELGGARDRLFSALDRYETGPRASPVAPGEDGSDTPGELGIAGHSSVAGVDPDDCSFGRESAAGAADRGDRLDRHAAGLEPGRLLDSPAGEGEPGSDPGRGVAPPVRRVVLDGEAESCEFLRVLSRGTDRIVVHAIFDGVPGRQLPVAIGLCRLEERRGAGSRGDEDGSPGSVDLDEAVVGLLGAELIANSAPLRAELGALSAAVCEQLAAGRRPADTKTFSLDPGDTPQPGVRTGPERGEWAHGPSPRGRLVGHRLKELYRALLQEGTVLGPPGSDTAVAAYLLDPGEGQTAITDLLSASSARDRAGGTAQEPGRTPRYSQSELGYSSLEAGAEAADSAMSPELERAFVETVEIVDLVPRLEEDLRSSEMEELYCSVELPLIVVLARMEVAGVAVDVARLEAINAEFTERAGALEADIWELAGHRFNVNSTPQLRTVLFDELRLTPGRRTKTGNSTDAATLERLRTAHPLVEALLSYRQIEKLRSTYGEGLRSEVGPDGRIHASFNQTVARTGRLSSDRPNLHNIPVRTEEGRRFREVFVAPPGSLLLVADYDQIELRVIAHLADDPGLLAAFRAHEDIHQATAARLFGVDPAEVTPTMRSKAKMVSYGLAYGMEAYGLSQRLGVELSEAAAILEQYFIAFPAVRAYMDRTVAEARARGYTETEHWHRRRYLPELDSPNPRLRQAAERQAMNAGIQGLAADIFKVALVGLDRALGEGRFAAHLVLQVHDEVLLEVPEGELDEVSRLTGDLLRTAYPLRAPLAVHLAAGPTWAAAKDP